MSYDDTRFGVINRAWFGLSRKWGGPLSNARTATVRPGCFATAHGTSIVHMAKWYPRGPIRITKAGSFVLSTLTNASSDLHIGRIRARGASASVAVSWYIKNTSTAISQAAFASNVPGLTAAGAVTTALSQNKAGDYISIMTATPTTDKATRVQATTSGTVAFFIDYVPLWEGSTNKWSA